MKEPSYLDKFLPMLWPTLLLLLSVISPFVVDAGQARQVKIAVPGLTNLIAFQVAQDKGYYRQEGLEIVPIVMAATLANQALIAGNVEINSAGGASLSAMLAGAPLKFIFTTFERPLHTLLATREIRDVKQLRRSQFPVVSVAVLTPI